MATVMLRDQRNVVRRLATAATVTVTSMMLAATPSAGSTPAPISASSFGMHVLGISGAYPPLRFGAARIWNMRVAWNDLRPTPGGYDAAAVARLDRIVATFRAHGADPLLTLGMTPAWAAASCNHAWPGGDSGVATCPPRYTGAASPWASYVRFLAQRYRGKVRYFELWNEPSLRSSYNGSITTLARMQVTASAILHQYGDKLLAPGIVVTNGPPQVGLSWLERFLSARGGGAFDIVSAHLYPSDAAAAAGWGPEWSIQQLGAIRAVLARHRLAGRAVWNTETNVGRVITHTTFSGTLGAAMVARTYVLATENQIRRTFWYAADDRNWGGTWLLESDYRTLTTAGRAYVTARNLLVGARPYGCARTTQGPHRWRYTCRYRLASGKSMRAVWSTGYAFRYHGPRGTQKIVTVSGVTRWATYSTTVTVGRAPIYVIGTFAP